ncbi:MAG: hypothetical protein KatS3mg105_5028 [Gemmatales bacterium]|nr:MAG: hypothetical protein KatS3mg105_5028 [Gemmatales bacterium]
MALPDYFIRTQGTAIVWGENGASGVTHVLSLNNLANGAARSGVYADLGANIPDAYLVFLVMETGATAPTAGLTYEVYLVSSHDASVWPAKLNGTDASYTPGSNDINLRQAGSPAAVLVATADANTVLRQAPMVWYPRGRYVQPILYNRSGQALANKTPASDNASRIIMIPFNSSVVD